MLWDVLWRNKNSFSLTFCVLFSLTGIFWQSGTNPFAKGVGYFGAVADRISGALNSGFQLPNVLWIEIAKYQELEKRYDQAQKMIEAYRLEKDKFDFLKMENDRLRKALAFSSSREFPELKAEVLGIRINSISPRIIIDKGRKHGIAPFMPVIAHAYDKNQNLIRAVVGIIAFASENVSVVQPINHPGFRLGIRINGTGQWAILTGNSGRIGMLRIENLTDQLSPFSVGEGDSTGSEIKNKMVVSSGEGGMFPHGIPVGILKEVAGDSAYVAPFVSLSTLDTVAVILKKPEPWVEVWDKKINWDEHLITEYGPAVFLEEQRVKKRKPTETRDRQKKQVKGEGNDKPVEQEESSDEPSRRRLQQLDSFP